MHKGPLNPGTTQELNELNAFTERLSRDPDNRSIVRLRNNQLAEVYIKEPMDDTCMLCIEGAGNNHMFHANGVAFKNSDYDIISLVKL